MAAVVPLSPALCLTEAIFHFKLHSVPSMSLPGEMSVGQLIPLPCVTWHLQIEGMRERGRGREKNREIIFHIGRTTTPKVTLNFRNKSVCILSKFLLQVKLL